MMLKNVNQKKCWQRTAMVGLGLIMFSILILHGCGGDDDDDDDIPPYTFTTLDGIAASGAPMVNAIVTIRDSATPPATQTTETNIHGTFQFEVTNMTPPYLVWATGTVNSEQATYYSTWSGDELVSGRVNITPLTHLAMAMALGENPTDYYASHPNAGPPNSSDLAASVRTITTLFNDMLKYVEAPEDFDVMTGEFAADGRGFDRLLEMINVTIENHACTIIENESGEILLQDEDISDEQAPQVMKSAEALIIPMGGLTAALEFLALIESVFADGVADVDEAESIMAWWADGGLERGLDNTQRESMLLTGTVERAPGIRYDEIEIHRVMYGQTDHPLGELGGISENGNHDLGFWFSFRYTDRDMVLKKFGSFVLEDGQWKFFGDRVPFYSGNTASPLASHMTSTYTNQSTIEVIQTGLSLNVYDLGLYGKNLGVEKVVIVNNALPSIGNPFGEGNISAVILSRDTTDPSGKGFTLTEPAGFIGNVYFTDMGLDLNALTGDDEFLHVALDENDHPLYTWATRLWQRPCTRDEVNERLTTHFPVITGVGNSAPLTVIPFDQLIDGPLLTWTVPQYGGIYPLGAKAEWRNLQFIDDSWQLILAQSESTQNPAIFNTEPNYGDWTSVSFSAPPLPPQWGQRYGRFTVWTHNESGRIFSRSLQYIVETPAP